MDAQLNKLQCWSFAVKGGAILAVANIAFWGLCIALRFPRVYTDDLFFLGPAFSLSDGAGLLNSFESRFVPGNAHFFVYPTFQYYLSAGWMTLFGRSPLALQFYWASWQFVGGLSLAQLMRRLGLRASAYVIAPVLLLGAVGYEGYRPEMVGLPMLLLGTCLLFTARGTWPRRSGSFFAFLAASIAPTFIVPSLVAVVASGALASRGDYHRLVSEFCGAFAAGLAVLVLNLFTIGFEITAFLHGIAANSVHAKGILHGQFGKTEIVILLHLVFVTGCYALLRYRFGDVARGITLRVIAVLGALCVAELLLYERAPAMVMLLGCIYIALLAYSWRIILTRRAPRDGAKVETPIFLLAAFLLMLNLHFGVGNFAFEPSPAVLAGESNAAWQAGRTLVLDSFVVRYIYRYRPLAGAVDFTFQLPMPGTYPKPFFVRPGDILLTTDFTLYRHYVVRPDDHGLRAQRASRLLLKALRMASTPFVDIEAFGPDFNALNFAKRGRAVRYCAIQGPFGATEGGHALSPMDFQTLLARHCFN